jgi:hypothetical protein
MHVRPDAGVGVAHRREIDRDLECRGCIGRAHHF